MWRIDDDALAALEQSAAWTSWATTENRFTAAEIYGPNGKLGFHWHVVHATADELFTALCWNMGGGVPIEVIRALVQAAHRPERG